jgi:TIR domain
MKPRILKLFISYAREDAPIAIAVSNCLQVALGNVFAEVFIDRKLEAGLDFSVQIQQKLDETDILIIIYSGVEKPSHSWTGVELGAQSRANFFGESSGSSFHTSRAIFEHQQINA